MTSHVMSSKQEPSDSPPYSNLPSSPGLPFLFDDNHYVVDTDDQGMILGDGSPTSKSSRVTAVKESTPRRKRQPVHYVSRHFAAADTMPKKGRVRRKSEVESSPESDVPDTPATATARIFYGLNVDELSSDSSLTDVPDDIGPDPFVESPRVVAVKSVQTPKKSKKPKHPTTSPYFPTPHKARSHFLSTLPFPPISRESFGLMQERLANRPFELLLATIFLNKTPGERAMPVCYKLLAQYPTPATLAVAKVEDITEIIRHLGFQNQRARKIVGLAKGWVECEPFRGVRYRKVDYPMKGDGKDIKDGEPVDDRDSRTAWEISHLPGLGPYSHDSWRMFCRDKLRGLASSWNGEGAIESSFEPEWKRVLPKDKELRAWMTWMWMKEGWVWNCETGKRLKADEELMELARGGGVVVEEHEAGKETLRLEQSVEDVQLHQPGSKVHADRPAGQILDEIKAGERAS
jgi:methyl-CpG-binding domain protein 4